MPAALCFAAIAVLLLLTMVERASVGTWLNICDLLLTVALVVCLIQEVMPLPVLFVLGFAIAVLVNHPTWEQQQALRDEHAKSSHRTCRMPAQVSNVPPAP
ncbi:hypothetical protein ACFYO0_43920 [Streptomyces sp. NPDC006365]|uniref:hypothetical protein n=1 Tax=Streptomyces sp. NPDC006365 TaxID=3364744 RepID=UPI0036AB8CC7